MSYSPFDRNPSGIVFFTNGGTEPVFDSDANFILATGANPYIRSPNLIIGDGGKIGSVTTSGAISIASNGNVSLTKSLSIAGDLVVNGTTTTVNSTVVTIQDPIIVLGSGSPTTDDNKDRGILFNYYSGSAKQGFFGFDDNTGKFTFIPDATIAGEVVSGTAGTIVANLEGNVTGNASTATTATNVTVTANNSGNESAYITFVDGASGDQGIETDDDLRYNPSTNTLTAVNFAGNLSGSASSLTNSRFIGVSGMMVGSGLFNGSADQVPNISAHHSLITAQTEATSANSSDQILIASGNNLRRITRANFISGLGAMSSFKINDGTINSSTIEQGDSIIFRPGHAISFVTPLNDDSVSGVLNSDVAGNGLSMSNQTLSVNVASGIQIANDTLRITAGSGLSVDANGVHVAAGGGLINTVAGLNVGAGTLIDVTADAVNVNLSEASNAAIANGDYLLFLDGGENGTAAKESFADFVSFMAGNGLASSSSVLNIGAGVGITVDANEVKVTKGSGVNVDSNGVHVALVSYAAQAVAANAASSTASRTYPIQVDINNDLVVNVPWTDVNELTTEEVQDIVGGMVTGNTETLITVTYADGGEGTGKLNFVVDSNLANYSNTTSNFFNTAGSGLTSSGSTVNVIGGDGITVNENEIEVAVDNSTIALSNTNGEGVIKVKDGGIDTTQLADGAVTEAKRERTYSSVSTTDSTVSSYLTSVNAASSAIDIYLPGSPSTGSIYKIKKIDSSANPVNIKRSGSQTIDNALSKVLYSQWESISLFYSGDNKWFII